MRRLPEQTLIEWGFIACLGVVCAVFSAFQYHWTNEATKATTDRLRNGLDGQTQLLGRAFDAELLGSCRQLLPEAEPLNAATREAVHGARLHQWQQSAKHRPLFSQLAVAVPEGGVVQLYELDQKTARLIHVPWPSEWSALHDNLTRQAAFGGNGPPFPDPAATLFDFPVFQNHAFIEWMIFELDLDYIADDWLPDLVRRYLSQDGRLLSDVSVHAWLQPDEVIYQTGTPGAVHGSHTASVRFNGQGWGTESPSRRGEDDFWVLTAWQRAGELEAILSGLRWRNFALGLSLDLLTLTAGFALLRYARRARRLSALHMRFVANASHELRTPLTVIRGAGQNLARGVASDPERVVQYGQFIIQHADQLNELVERMLELADVRRVSSAPKYQAVNLNEILQGAVASTLAVTRAAGCKVEAHILSRLPEVSGDAAALRRVFQNLITNAAKYGASGGWIGLKTERIEDGPVPVVEIRVEDRGPGIPAAEQAHLFEPFARGASARQRQVQGSGLGLSMVHETVQAHGGTVSLRSAPGRGTIFIVRLPVRREQAR